MKIQLGIGIILLLMLIGCSSETPVKVGSDLPAITEKQQPVVNQTPPVVISEKPQQPIEPDVAGLLAKEDDLAVKRILNVSKELEPVCVDSFPGFTKYTDECISVIDRVILLNSLKSEQYARCEIIAGKVKKIQPGSNYKIACADFTTKTIDQWVAVTDDIAKRAQTDEDTQNDDVNLRNAGLDLATKLSNAQTTCNNQVGDITDPAFEKCVKDKVKPLFLSTYNSIAECEKYYAEWGAYACSQYMS